MSHERTLPLNLRARYRLVNREENSFQTTKRPLKAIKRRTRKTDKKQRTPTMNIQLKPGREGIQRRQGPPLNDIRALSNPRITLTDRLRSGYHRIWYEATQALRWSRGSYRETPIGTDLNLTPSQRARIKKLAGIYGARFEFRYPPETTLLNYGYLDLLDRASQTLNWTISQHQQVCDVGSSNFAYAAALQTFFHPSNLVGIEVEGHRLYCNGRSRIDYANGHIQDLPNTHYVVRDYRQYNQPAEIITAWFPFVTPKPLLAWRLPLSLFDPAAIFAQIANNLVLGGTFVMINHSPIEATVARNFTEGIGLVCRGQYVHDTPLRPRTQPAVLTLWHHS